MPACFGICRAIESVPCGLLKVQHRFYRLSSFFEMSGKLGGNRRRSISVGALQTAADLPVETGASLRGGAHIYHFLDEVVAKAIASRQGAVRPSHRGVGIKKLTLTGPCG